MSAQYPRARHRRSRLRWRNLGLLSLMMAALCLPAFKWQAVLPAVNQPVAPDNLIEFSAGPLDTSLPAAQMMRERVPLPGGSKQIHLVQFHGPVQAEWRAALESTGIQVVQPIPNNAYLVYGNAIQLSQLWTWIDQNNDIVQWDGPYRSEYKIGNFAPPPTGADGQSQLSDRGVAAPQHAGFAPPVEFDGFEIQLINDPAQNPGTIDRIRQELQIGSVECRPPERPSVCLALQGDYVNLTILMAPFPPGVAQLQSAAAAPRAAGEVAKQPDVVKVDPYIVPQKEDERQAMIIAGNLVASEPAMGDYLLDFLAARGFGPGPSDFAVNIADSGIDNGTQMPNHFALYVGGNIGGASRVVYNRLEGRANPGSTLKGCDGHGTLNTHILGGYVPSGLSGGVNYFAYPHADASRFRYGLGIAPFVKLGSSVIFDADRYTFPNLLDLEARAYRDGARISSNSWGAGAPANLNPGQYTIAAQTVDALVRDAQPARAAVVAPGNQEQVIIFAAGNSGLQGVNSPGTAKNVITVGAAENAHPFGGDDGCKIGDALADSAHDVAGFSSRGPTVDGRSKPDLVAPGTHVTGGVIQASKTPGPFGLADPCYLPYIGDNVKGSACGSAGLRNNFFPLLPPLPLPPQQRQQFYTASSGTSHAVPAVAGAAAIVRQHFINQRLAPPSPAMTKALLINSARYLTGAGANDDLWSRSQGLGAVNLTSFFDFFVTPTLRRDQLAEDLFTASGQTLVITAEVADQAKPVRITFAYTDAPGGTMAAAYVNNLDLEVSVGGALYKGNVFNKALSVAGGVADRRNNVESVFLPAGTRGPFTVVVRATNLPGDGVPGNDALTDQDFALVIYNAKQSGTALRGQVKSVSSASYQSLLASDAIVAAFGANLATGTQVAPAVPLPTALASARVLVRDQNGAERSAGLFFASSNQINYHLPPGTAAGAARVSILNGDVMVAAETVRVAAVAPGLFSADASGRGLAAGAALRVRASGEQSFEQIARFDRELNRVVAVPLDLGPPGERVFLVLFGTGWRQRSALEAVAVKLGGVSAPVSFAGAQGGLIGLDQLNLEIPRSLAGRGLVSIEVTVDGKPANTTQVNIR